MFWNISSATRSRSRSNIQMDQHGDHEGSSQEPVPAAQAEEVLVISLGTAPQVTPGMMSENEVRRNAPGSAASAFSKGRTVKLWHRVRVINPEWEFKSLLYSICGLYLSNFPLIVVFFPLTQYTCKVWEAIYYINTGQMNLVGFCRSFVTLVLQSKPGQLSLSLKNLYFSGAAVPGSRVYLLLQPCNNQLACYISLLGDDVMWWGSWRLPHNPDLPPVPILGPYILSKLQLGR